MVTGPSASAATAVMKRDVVPASPAWSRPAPLTSRPPVPTTRARSPPTDNVTPSPARQSVIARVSSPRGTPVSSLSPSARAAQISARLAMLFEPGTSTTASSGPVAVPTRRTSVIPALN